jgi:hypothetical protein
MSKSKSKHSKRRGRRLTLLGVVGGAVVGVAVVRAIASGHGAEVARHLRDIADGLEGLAAPADGDAPPARDLSHDLLLLGERLEAVVDELADHDARLHDLADYAGNLGLLVGSSWSNLVATDSAQQLAGRLGRQFSAEFDEHMRLERGVIEHDRSAN